MVYFRENPSKMDDDLGYPYDSGNLRISMRIVKHRVDGRFPKITKRMVETLYNGIRNLFSTGAGFHRKAMNIYGLNLDG